MEHQRPNRDYNHSYKYEPDCFSFGFPSEFPIRILISSVIMATALREYQGLCQICGTPATKLWLLKLAKLAAFPMHRNSKGIYFGVSDLRRIVEKASLCSVQSFPCLDYSLKILKVSKSRKQIMKSRIFPKTEWNSLKILSWVCIVCFLEESKTS